MAKIARHAYTGCIRGRVRVAGRRKVPGQGRKVLRAWFKELWAAEMHYAEQRAWGNC